MMMLQIIVDGDVHSITNELLDGLNVVQIDLNIAGTSASVLPHDQLITEMLDAPIDPTNGDVCKIHASRIFFDELRMQQGRRLLTFLEYDITHDTESTSRRL